MDIQKKHKFIFKKVTAVFLTALLFSMMFDGYAFAADEIAINDNQDITLLSASDVIYQEDLSGYTNGTSADKIQGWEIYYDGGANFTTDPCVIEDGSVKFTKSIKRNSNARVAKTFTVVPKQGKVIYEFNAKFPVPTSPFYSMRFFKLYAGGINGSPLFPTELNDTGVTLGEVKSATTTEWQNYKYILNYDTGKYNIVVDGKYLTKNSSPDFTIPQSFITGGNVNAFEFQVATYDIDVTTAPFIVYEKGFKIYKAPAPAVVSTSIADTTKAPVDSPITLNFNTELDVSTVTQENVVLSTAEGEAIDSIIEMVNGNMGVKITPRYGLEYNTQYKIVLKTGILSTLNIPLTSEQVIPFKTDTPLLEVTNVTPQSGNGTFAAAVEVKSRLAYAKEVSLVMCVYNANKLSKMVFVKKTIAAGMTDTMNISAADLPTSDYAELYFWDGIDAENVQALRAPYIFGTTKTSPIPTMTFEQLPAVDVQMNPDTQELTVFGQSNIKRANQHITIRVLNPGKTLGSIAPDVELGTVINRIGQATTDKDGKFTWTYKVNGANGKYHVLVGMPSHQTAFSGEFYYVSPESVAAALAQLNAANRENIQTVVQTNRELLGFTNSLFDTLIDKNTVCLYLLNQNFTTVNMAIEMFNKAVVIQSIKEKSNLNDAIDLMKANRNLLGIHSKSTYNRFDSMMTKEQKEAVITALKSSNYAKVSEFADRFHAVVVIKSIEMAIIWNDIDGILKGSNDVLGWNFSAYDALSENTQKPEVLKSIIGKSFTDLNDLKFEFDKAVKDVSMPKISEGNSSGGGGKSSYSWGGAVPIVADPEIMKPNDKININISDVFTDMTQDHWAASSVAKLYSLGIVNGKGDKNFAPNDIVTREELIKMLITSLNMKIEGAQCQFSDVRENEWYYPYLASAYEKKMIDGMEDGRFGIGMGVTRQDMAAMVYRAGVQAGAIFDEDITIKPFSDENMIAEYAFSPVQILRENDIMNGIGNNVFAPAQTVTRAEAAKTIDFLIRFYESNSDERIGG